MHTTEWSKLQNLKIVVSYLLLHIAYMSAFSVYSKPGRQGQDDLPLLSQEVTSALSLSLRCLDVEFSPEHVVYLDI